MSPWAIKGMMNQIFASTSANILFWVLEVMQGVTEDLMVKNCSLLGHKWRFPWGKERDVTFGCWSHSLAVKYLSWMAELRGASGLRNSPGALWLREYLRTRKHEGGKGQINCSGDTVKTHSRICCDILLQQKVTAWRRGFEAVALNLLVFPLLQAVSHAGWVTGGWNTTWKYWDFPSRPQACVLA